MKKQRLPGILYHLLIATGPALVFFLYSIPRQYVQTVRAIYYRLHTYQYLLLALSSILLFVLMGLMFLFAAKFSRQIPYKIITIFWLVVGLLYLTAEIEILCFDFSFPQLPWGWAIIQPLYTLMPSMGFFPAFLLGIYGTLLVVSLKRRKATPGA